MSKLKKVKAINPNTTKIENGVIVNEKSFRKLYQVKFDNGGEYWVSKSQVQFIQ